MPRAWVTGQSASQEGVGVVVRALLAAGSVYELSAQLDDERVIVEEGAA